MKSYMLCKRYTGMYDFLIHRRILFVGFFFVLLENECIIF